MSLKHFINALSSIMFYDHNFSLGVADVEDTLDHLISDIESRARLDSLTRKMKDILKTLVEWRLLTVKTAKGSY